MISELKKHIKNTIRSTPGLTQTIVAERVGISQPYLNEVLNSHKQGTFELLRAICEAIGFSITDWISQYNNNKIVIEDEEEATLITYFRGLDTKKRFLLLNIAADYFKYCKLVKEGKIKPD